MTTLALFTVDLLAISVLVFGLYLPRHRRKDLVVAFLGVNVGVLAVAEALTSSGVSAGLGLGLFGVLSIIRLRSTELDQEEVAYYFASLALGLLGGLSDAPLLLTISLMAIIVGVLWVGDHPRLFGSYRTQELKLGTAITDEARLKLVLEDMLGGRVRHMKVRRIDLVNDTTTVEVRWQLPAAADDATRDNRAQPAEVLR